jgi:hypothetical protein
VGFKELCPGVPQNMVQDAKYARFPSHNNRNAEMRRNILTFPKWDETSIGFGEPSSSHELEEERN